MLGTGAAISMTDEEFRLIRDLICDYCGIFFPDSMKFLIERRLQPRLPIYDLAGFREYFRLVKYGRERDKELDEIVERITTNETYFFRELYQLSALVEEIVPLLTGELGLRDRIRIWSAGCSTGEEPYSIAMLLDSNSQTCGQAFDIFGNDISRKVLRTARSAVYTRSSFRDTEPKYVEKYFTSLGRTFQLHERIRNLVTFGHLNLMDDSALGLIGNVDVILCRNVLIYFAAESRRRLVDTFFHKLRPGGFLLLGHAESLMHETTDFELTALTKDVVYRKPKASSLGRVA